jgi:uncharacterized protein (TIGR00290 family)
MDVMKERVLLSWSGGKDSALALHELGRSDRYEVAALLTTVTEGTGRIGMHAVRRELLVEQAEALGLPLRELVVPPFPANEVYEAAMRGVLGEYAALGIRSVAFGDLFLEDIRAYRERLLAALDMEGVYPIWARDTAALAREFVGLGFRAVLVCVDLEVLDASFAGRELDRALLAELPSGVDPCGENGEFHTFVFDGPGFRAPVAFERGDVRRESSFAFCDLVPV